MADPVRVACPANQWTKVATSVYKGSVFVDSPGTNVRATYKETGGSAPTLRTEATYETINQIIPIDSTPSELVDIYIWPDKFAVSAVVSV